MIQFLSLFLFFFRESAVDKLTSRNRFNVHFYVLHTTKEEELSSLHLTRQLLLSITKFKEINFHYQETIP